MHTNIFYIMAVEVFLRQFSGSKAHFPADKIKHLWYFERLITCKFTGSYMDHI